MRTLEIPNLPDELYEQIEKLARVRGTSVGEVAKDFIAKALSRSEEAESALLAEIRAAREEMAKRGVWITAEDLQEAKNWGRK